MRCILQRALSGSVTVSGRLIGSISRGLVILVGIRREDTIHDANYMINKILNLRLFDDPISGKSCHLSVSQLQFPILLVSQFTLYAQLKGNKLDFHNAMGPEYSNEYWRNFIELFKKSYKSELIEQGEFGADMKLSILNDGPFTINLSSDEQDFTTEIKKAAKLALYSMKKENKSGNGNNFNEKENISGENISVSTSVSDSVPSSIEKNNSTSTNTITITITSTKVESKSSADEKSE